jgi:hypothetical protein
MRNALLKSTALAALLIVSSVAYAQAPSESNRNEPKNEKTEKSAPPKQQERGAQPEQRSGAAPEQKGAAEQSPRKPDTNRAGNEGPGNRNAAEEHKKPEVGQASQPAKAEQKSEQKADQNDARRKNAQERRQSEPKGAASRNAEGAKEPDKSKSTAAPSRQQEQKKDASTPAPQNQQPAAAQSSTPSSNSATSTTTQQPTSSAATTNNVQRGTTTATNANQLPPQKQVQISETISRTRVAPPQRNINVSINIGTVVPPRVRFHPLPREIWSIEPRYRGYEYFSTEEDIVIIEPRTRRVVSLIPRDPARARAQVTTTTTAAGTMTQASAGAPPCQIMRRDPNGQLTEVRPSTVGAGGSNAPLSVTVQLSNGQISSPVALDAPAGQIVVATQGNGDCQITIEPQQR